MNTKFKIVKFALKKLCDEFDINRLASERNIEFCQDIACDSCAFDNPHGCLLEYLSKFSYKDDDECKPENPMQQFTNEQLVEELNRRLVK